MAKFVLDVVYSPPRCDEPDNRPAVVAGTSLSLYGYAQAFPIGQGKSTPEKSTQGTKVSSRFIDPILGLSETFLLVIISYAMITDDCVSVERGRSETFLEC